jgi:hypothetical protein
MSQKMKLQFSRLLASLSIIVVFLTCVSTPDLLVIPAWSFVFSDDSLASGSSPPSDSSTHVVRDSETILLAGQIIPSGDYIHVYDASPYKIVNGHLATKIPCDQSFQPIPNILVGQAPKLQSIQLHLIEELSTPGKLCIYHADLQPSSRVTHTMPNVTVGTITDIAIQNPTQEAIEFPATTSLVIGVNEIEPGAGEIEH